MTESLPPDRARELAGRAERAIEAGRESLRSTAPKAAHIAAEQAFEAFVLVAQACLDHDGVVAQTREETLHGYLARFGRGGRLYAAYYRWMLDAADLARACALGLPGADALETVELSLERAQTFWDAADRFLDRTA